MFLNIFQNPQENTCDRISFSIKLQASGELGIRSLEQPQVFCYCVNAVSFTTQKGFNKISTIVF